MQLPPANGVEARQTIYLGRLIGLYCIIVALVMLSHKQATVETITQFVHDGPLLFFASLVAMVLGLAIILAQPVRTRGSLPVFIKIVGWISFIKGLIFIVLSPATSVRYFEALHYGQFFYAYMAITLAIGVYLTYASFTARSQ